MQGVTRICQYESAVSIAIFEHRFQAVGLGLPLCLASQVCQMVATNLAYPGEQVRLAAEVTNGPDGVDQRDLNGVFECGALEGGPAPDEPRQVRGICVEELIERCLFALAHPLDEMEIRVHKVRSSKRHGH